MAKGNKGGKMHMTGRALAIAMLCCVIYSAMSINDPSDRIYLLHSDILYKNYQDPRAEVLVGHVKLSHKGCIMYCDSAKFYRDDNSFDAFGNVKMLQGDTLTLTSDTLFYEGENLTAKARGNVVLTHHKTRLLTDHLDYDRMYGVGMYMQGGTLYDDDNVLNSRWGQYTPSTHESFFTDNVNLENPSFTLISDTLFYNTQTKVARIVSPTNIETDDSTFVYGMRGCYNTNTGEADLTDRSYIIKDMRRIIGDSLHYNKEKHFSEGFNNVVINDDENMCILYGDLCQYDNQTGYAMATDKALLKEYSQGDTAYVHADTLKMFTYDLGTDSVTRTIHAYHKVKLYRSDVQAVCDSMVSVQKDSCTYLFGQPILWNGGQQLFGETIHVFNNDSTVRLIHVINQAMAIEQTDSVTFNEVSSREMYSYFTNGQIDRNEAHGNVYVIYYVTEDKGQTKLFMNYSETTKMIMFMQNKKIEHIWMPAATCSLYPVLQIPPDKKHLKGFAWFDYVRPTDPDDVFNWRGKSAENVLVAEKKHNVPLQKLNKNGRPTQQQSPESSQMSDQTAPSDRSDQSDSSATSDSSVQSASSDSSSQSQ
ncbi:MAG: hypothetical protein IKH26_00225 [Bacteroidaceae bacterium]|nr:hypothetical protein [Bacteroidaceae bacterium]